MTKTVYFFTFLFSLFISLFFVQNVYSVANPASVFCVDSGGKLEIREEKNGQVGYCIFPDGVECEEWEYFRKCANETRKSKYINKSNYQAVKCRQPCDQLTVVPKASISNTFFRKADAFFISLVNWLKGFFRLTK